MTPTHTPEPTSGRRSDSAADGAPAPKSLKAALAAAEAPAAPVDPLADPPTIEGVPLTSYRLPDWFIWAALGTAFVVVGGIGLLAGWSIAAVVALIVLKIAAKPADADHQFGHSKAEYFSAVVEGVMIFVAAAVIIISAIERLINPQMPEQLGAGLAVSVIASLLNGAVAWVLYRAGRRERSMTLVADAKHLATDVITSAAVLIGVALVAVFHSALLDAVVALGAGLNIMWTGFTLIRDSVGGLMDIAPSAEVLRTVEEVLARHRQTGMIDFHAVRVREAGNRRFMELHVLVPAAWSVKKGHDFTEQVIDELIEADTSLRISAHLEPIEDPKSYEDLEDM